MSDPGAGIAADGVGRGQAAGTAAVQRVVVQREDLLGALRWLRQVRDLTQEGSLLIRPLPTGSMEWGCAGQWLTVRGSGRWEGPVVAQARMLLLLEEGLLNQSEFAFERTGSGFMVERMIFQAKALGEDPPGVDLPAGAPDRLILREASKRGEAALRDAGYGDTVTRALTLRAERCRKAAAILAPQGVSALEVEALVDRCLDCDRTETEVAAERERVRLAAAAFAELAVLGVPWAMLWAIVAAKSSHDGGAQWP